MPPNNSQDSNLPVLAIFVSKVDHGFQVFRFYFVHDGTRTHDESAIFPDDIDKPLAVLLDALNVAHLQQ